MGVTIFYKGTINDPSAIDALREEIIDIAETMGWTYTRLDEDLSKPCTAEMVVKRNRADIKGHLPLKGIAFQPHESCETVQLYFDGRGRLNDPVGMILAREGKIKEENHYLSVKTQFAPLETHITIIKLFRHFKKKYFSDLVVEDEGGYWETDDAHELQRRIASINGAMDYLENALSTMKVKNRSQMTPDEIATHIENIFNKKFGRKARRKKR